MSRVFFALLALLAVAVTYSQGEVRSEDCNSLTEDYSTCAYTIERTCTNPLQRPFSTFCTPGCQCKPDLVRSYTGECKPLPMCFPYKF